MPATHTPSTNPLVYVGESAIHGRGLFAAEAIEADALIGEFEGPRTKRDGPHVLWVIEDDGSEYGVRGANELRFVNHSSEPNAVFWGAELWSLRAIAKDEEITFDYGPDWQDG